MGLTPEQDFVLRTVKSRNVRFIRLAFTDVMGNLKSFAITPNDLEEAFAAGVGFNAQPMKGLVVNGDADLYAVPDPATFQVSPWRHGEDAVARMICILRTFDNKPCAGGVRQILQRVMQQAADAGLVMGVGADISYFYFTGADSREPYDCGEFFDVTPLDGASELRRETVLATESMGIPVAFSGHGAAPGQSTIVLRTDDALAMADAVITFKWIAREVAARHGVTASFTSRPYMDKPGSGMPLHLSMSTLDGEDAFFDENAENGAKMGMRAQHFAAGILRYAPECMLVTNQFVNSYRRLIPGLGEPTYAGWARCAKGSLLRVPRYRAQNLRPCEMELRSPDPSCNPYLSFALIVSAGLRGIAEELPLPPACEDSSLNELSRRQLRQRGLVPLPETLGEAVALFEKSEFARDVLGAHVHSYLVDAKYTEWEHFLQQLTSWELKHLWAGN